MAVLILYCWFALNPFADLRPRPMDAGSHRADRHIENGGGLLVCQFAYRNEKERFPIGGRQLQERREQQRPQALRVEPLGRVIGWDGTLLGQPSVRTQVILLLPEMMTNQVRGDPEEPRSGGR